jgi:hypothetical protein
VSNDSLSTETEGPRIVIEYQLTAAECKRALRWVMLRRRRFYIAPVLGLLFIVIGIIFLVVPDGVGAGAICLSAGIVFTVEFGWLVWWLPGRAWRRNESIRGPQHLAVSDEGVETKNAISEGRSQWALYKSSYKTRAATCC